MTKRSESDINDTLIMTQLNKFGGLTSQEIAQNTQLTKHQTRLSIARLRDAGKIFEKKGNYYPAASKLESFVINNLWNGQVFAGLQL